MYRAKASGGKHYAFYAAEMAAEAEEHLRIENGLQRGLLRGEFVLHYQPQVDAGSGRIVGVEALLRWQPEGGAMVSPADFIPLAEETGLIVPIGEWALARGAAPAGAFRRDARGRAAAHEREHVGASVPRAGRGRQGRAPAG
jgi:predicted signal transduction protein with EAL and GGDEF domain